MSFANFPQQAQGVELLQRSLERGRLGHAYLFTGDDLAELELLASTLARTLNCERPRRSGPGQAAVDCCDACSSCKRIASGNHPDIHWIRPESKTRIIPVDQMRGLMQEMNLKPNEAAYKAGIIVAADRMNNNAANAFLKTLEEPPPGSLLILLSSEPQRLLETILSRCLRLNFGAAGVPRLASEQAAWLEAFGQEAANDQGGLLSRYRLLDFVLHRLAGFREAVEKSMSERSPLARFDDVESDLKKQWEDELNAAVEAEYRLRRMELLKGIQWWMRDVWLRTMRVGEGLLFWPESRSAPVVAGRISARQAEENLQSLERLQRLLHTNVQESLALEVGLLKLHF